MRKSFVLLNLPRTLFADILFLKSRKIIQHDDILYDKIVLDINKYLPKRINFKSDLSKFNYLLITDKIFRTVFYYRVESSEKLQSSIFKAVSLLFLKRLENIEIGVNGDGAIGGGLRIVHKLGCVVAVCQAGKNLTVHQGVTIGVSSKKSPSGSISPTIGDNVTVFANAVVAGGIFIGDNVTIGAGSVVLDDIPSDCVVAGNPAKIIKYK